MKGHSQVEVRLALGWEGWCDERAAKEFDLTKGALHDAVEPYHHAARLPEMQEDPETGRQVDNGKGR